MESWKVEDTVKLAEILAEMGVDLLDVSSGGLHPKQKLKTGPGYQAPFSKAVKEKLGDKLAVGVVGTITNGEQAQKLLEEGLDLAIVGRMFQKNPVRNSGTRPLFCNSSWAARHDPGAQTLHLLPRSVSFTSLP